MPKLVLSNCPPGLVGVWYRLAVKTWHIIVEKLNIAQSELFPAVGSYSCRDIEGTLELTSRHLGALRPRKGLEKCF